VQVTDQDIIRWINDGQVEIVKNNDTVLQKTGLLNLVIDQQEYALPADLLILRSLRFKFSSMLSFSALRYVSIQQFDELADGWDGTAYGTSQPIYFTKYEDKIALFPIPSEASTNGLKVLYNQKPTDVDDLSDTLAVPLLYHNTIVKYCIYQASLLDEDYEPSVMHLSNFKADVDLMSNRENIEPTGTYPIITILTEDAW
jgi:hypothetical protein